jgi:hypothetical protein
MDSHVSLASLDKIWRWIRWRTVLAALVPGWCA